MNVVDSIRDLADLASELARLPDGIQVSAGTAALLISVEDPPSQRTMERWRQGRKRSGETGPPFIAGPGRTSAVSYNVGEVRSWVRAQRAKNTMEVSSRRGLSFGSIVDLARPEPWVMRGEKVLGHALTVSPEDLANAVTDLEGTVFVVCGLDEVMRGVRWMDASSFEVFHRVFLDVLHIADEESSRVKLATDLGGNGGLRFPEASDDGLCRRGCGRPEHAGSCRL